MSNDERQERMFNKKLIESIDKGIDALNNLASAVRDASSQHGTNVILDRLDQVETKLLTEMRVSNEDRQMLDATLARAVALSVKMRQLAAKVRALDDSTTK